MKKIIPISIALVSVIVIISVVVSKGFKKEFDKQAVPVINQDDQVSQGNLNDSGKLSEKSYNISDLISSAQKDEGTVKKYVDNIVGYQLNIPDSWEGYMVSRISSVPDHSQVAFGFMKKNSNDFYGMMVLSEQPKNIYKSSNNEESGLVYVGEVKKNDNVVLCEGSCCKGIVSDIRFNVSQKNQCKKVPEILKTFKAI